MPPFTNQNKQELHTSHTQDRIRNMINNEGAELLHRLGPLTQCSLPDMVGDVHDIPAGRSRLGLQRRLAAQIRLALAASLWEELDDTHPLSQEKPLTQTIFLDSTPATAAMLGTRPTCMHCIAEEAF